MIKAKVKKKRKKEKRSNFSDLHIHQEVSYQCKCCLRDPGDYSVFFCVSVKYDARQLRIENNLSNRRSVQFRKIKAALSLKNETEVLHRWGVCQDYLVLLIELMMSIGNRREFL